MQRKGLKSLKAYLSNSGIRHHVYQPSRTVEYKEPVSQGRVISLEGGFE